MDTPQLTARTKELPPVLTSEQARAILNLGRNQMYELLRSGVIPAVRLGRQWRIPTARLFDWLNSGGNTGVIEQIEAARPGRDGAALEKGEETQVGNIRRLSR